jgi:hypothetical protein
MIWPSTKALGDRNRDRGEDRIVRRVHRFAGQQCIPEGTQVPAGDRPSFFNGSLMSFTNVDTGKTITENVSGSGKAIMHPDGSLSIRQAGHLGLITVEAADAERFGPPLGVIGGVLPEEIARTGPLLRCPCRVTSWWTSAALS